MPTYKNPPIAEAVCEFTFEPLKGNPEWDLTLPGKLQLDPDLKEYSDKSRQQHVQTIAASDNKGQPQLALQQGLFRVHLPRPDNTALLSLGHNILGIVVLKPYEGWEKFEPRIIRALKVYTGKTGLSVVRRLGLRYINRIVTPDPNAASAGLYLSGMVTAVEAAAQDEKTKVEGKLTAVNSRQEFVTSDGIKIFVTQATLKPQKPKTAEYLLDIDIVRDHEPLDGPEKITQVIDKLHTIEGAIFEHFITPEARKLFDA
ncbi:MAG TPA: TIGR04255 family protein [Hyphomicrobiaceae bacterium]|nr:TIGR04255 family protein [Hyphomicrobiaceae bacterium]